MRGRWQGGTGRGDCCGIDGSGRDISGHEVCGDGEEQAETGMEDAAVDSGNKVNMAKCQLARLTEFLALPRA